MLNKIKPEIVHHRIIAFAIVILVTSIVVGGGVYLSQSQQNGMKDRLITKLEDKELVSSSKLAEYQSQTGTFSFKHKEGWNVYEAGTGTTAGHKEGLSLGPDENNFNVVSLSLFSSDLSPKEWVLKNAAKISEEKELNVSTYPAYYYKSSEEGQNSFTSRTYVISNKGYILSITFDEKHNTPQLKDNTRYSEDFEAIVSSIKFK